MYASEPDSGKGSHNAFAGGTRAGGAYQCPAAGRKCSAYYCVAGAWQSFVDDRPDHDADRSDQTHADEYRGYHQQCQYLGRGRIARSVWPVGDNWGRGDRRRQSPATTDGSCVMKYLVRFAAALLLLLCSGSAHAQQSGFGQTCNATKIYDASTNGSTLLVAAGGPIYICGYTFFAGGTASVKLISGTQTTNPCDTGTVAITPAYPLTTQTGVVDGSPVFRGMDVLPNTALCLNTNAGVAVQAVIYFYQVKPQ